MLKSGFFLVFFNGSSSRSRVAFLSIADHITIKLFFFLFFLLPRLLVLIYANMSLSVLHTATDYHIVQEVFELPHEYICMAFVQKQS